MTEDTKSKLIGFGVTIGGLALSTFVEYLYRRRWQKASDDAIARLAAKIESSSRAHERLQQRISEIEEKIRSAAALESR